MDISPILTIKTKTKNLRLRGIRHYTYSPIHRKRGSQEGRNHVCILPISVPSTSFRVSNNCCKKVVSFIDVIDGAISPSERGQGAQLTELALLFLNPKDPI